MRVRDLRQPDLGRSELYFRCGYGILAGMQNVDAAQVRRLREVANWVNLTTPLGLAIARIGRATVRKTGRGIYIATDYRYGFPVASAFTIGSVITTKHDRPWVEARPALLAHEERHSSQYAACLGLPFFPLYIAAMGWSQWRTGSRAAGNVFEQRAGLADGRYDVPTADEIARMKRRRRAWLGRLVKRRPGGLSGSRDA